MSYYLTGFGGVTFPTTMPVTDMPTVPGLAGTVRTLGGGFDAWGTDTAKANFPVRVQYRVLVVDVVATSLLTKINAMRAMGRDRDYLYRSGGGVEVQRATARLVDVSATSTVRTNRAIEVTMNFDVWSNWSTNWARGFTLDSGYFFDAGLTLDTLSTLTTLTTNPQTIIVANGGNLPVDDVTVTLVAGSAPITVLTIQCGSAVWEWTGTLAIGKSLVIDGGTWSVTNDNADAYSGFVFYPAHAIAGILRLEPGDNTVYVWHTGGGTGSTISFDFADEWA